MSEKIKRWMTAVDKRLGRLERSRSRPSKGGGLSFNALETIPVAENNFWEETRENLLKDPIVPSSANDNWQVNTASWNNPTRLEMGTLFEVSGTVTALNYVARPNTTNGLTQLTAGTKYYFRWEMENRGSGTMTLRTLIMRGTGTGALSPINTVTLQPGQHYSRVEEFTPTVSDGYRLGVQFPANGANAGDALFIPDSWGIFEEKNTALVKGPRLYPTPPGVQDTGWRNIASSIVTANFMGSLDIRRTGNVVFLRASLANNQSGVALPFLNYSSVPGFLPEVPEGSSPLLGAGVPWVNMDKVVAISAASSHFLLERLSGEIGYELTISYPTSDPWPTTLPGTPYTTWKGQDHGFLTPS